MVIPSENNVLSLISLLKASKNYRLAAGSVNPSAMVGWWMGTIEQQALKRSEASVLHGCSCKPARSMTCWLLVSTLVVLLTNQQKMFVDSRYSFMVACCCLFVDTMERMVLFRFYIWVARFPAPENAHRMRFSGRSIWCWRLHGRYPIWDVVHFAGIPWDLYWLVVSSREWSARSNGIVEDNQQSSTSTNRGILSNKLGNDLMDPNGIIGENRE